MRQTKAFIFYTPPTPSFGPNHMQRSPTFGTILSVIFVFETAFRAVNQEISSNGNLYQKQALIRFLDKARVFVLGKE